MRKPILFAMLLISTLVACKKKVTDTGKDQTPCAPKMCTYVFSSVTVKFLNKSGQPVTVTNYKAVNQRTGAEIKNTGATNADLNPGIYIVATDSNLRELSDEGDNILVSGTDPSTSKTKTATIKISGGCACHVAKVSGVEQITFD